MYNIKTFKVKKQYIYKIQNFLINRNRKVNNIEITDLEIWIIIKLYRRGYIGRPLDFNNIIHSKIAKKDLEKALKNLLNLGILIRKPSTKSTQGRWALNPRTKNIWENMAIKAISEGK